MLAPGVEPRRPRAANCGRNRRERDEAVRSAGKGVLAKPLPTGLYRGDRPEEVPVLALLATRGDGSRAGHQDGSRHLLHVAAEAFIAPTEWSETDDFARLNPTSALNLRQAAGLLRVLRIWTVERRPARAGDDHEVTERIRRHVSHPHPRNS